MQIQSVKYLDASFAFANLFAKAKRGEPLRVDKTLEEQKAVWREHPDLYAEQRLNLKLTDSQRLILYSVLNNRRTAVKAHHSLGKTFISAVLALWWIDCFDSHIVYITAPTWSQALGLTFKQAKRLAIINNLDFEILESGLIRDKNKFKQTERFIKALNADSGEGFQGEHAAPILIIIDEAIGVASYIFEASGGLMTDKNCRQLEIANPTDEATDFGEHCESSNYQVFSFSALEHPNIEAELNCLPMPFPNAVSLQWLFEMFRDETEIVEHLAEDCFEFWSMETMQNALQGLPVNQNSTKSYYKGAAYFQGRVLGEFPTEATNKIIPKGWIKNAPILPLVSSHPIQLGVDVARFGDDRTSIFARCGSIALIGKEIRKFDHLQIVEAVKDVLGEVGKLTNQTNLTNIPINIDITGGLGTAPFDLLKSEGYKVIGINSSEKAKEETLYRNKRSELWFEIRDFFKDKNIDLSRLNLDLRGKLEKELSAPDYKVSGGKKVVEEKSETKKRLGYSPDLADGLNLAFYSSNQEWGISRRASR